MKKLIRIVMSSFLLHNLKKLLPKYLFVNKKGSQKWKVGGLLQISLLEWSKFKQIN